MAEKLEGVGSPFFSSPPVPRLPLLLHPSSFSHSRFPSSFFQPGLEDVL